MHATDYRSEGLFSKSLPEMAERLNSFTELLRSRPMITSADGTQHVTSSVSDTWKIVRFYRQFESLIEKHWADLPYELRQEGRPIVKQAHAAVARLDDLSLRETLGMAILSGWRFVNLVFTIRASARVFRAIERKLAEEDRRANEAWERGLAHHPSFAEAARFGVGNYDRGSTVEADWETFRSPHGN